MTGRALLLALAAGAGLGLVQWLDLLATATHLPWSWRVLSCPLVVGLWGTAALPLAVPAAAVLSRRTRWTVDGASWVLSVSLSFCVFLAAAAWMVARWSSEPLDFPVEAAAGVGGAAAVLGLALAVVTWTVGFPVSRALVRRLGPGSVRVVLPLLGAVPLYLLASRWLPAVHLDRYGVALGLGVAAILQVPIAALVREYTTRVGLLAALAALALAVGGSMLDGGRRAVHAASPLASDLLSRALDARDFDGDGHAAWWSGGTDCDDTDPATQPGAPERPGNGSDDNCLAGDADPTEVTRATAALGVGGSSPEAVRRHGPVPNLVLLTVDALRADRLVPSRMPRLSARAARGTRFVRAYAPGSHTQSSLPVMLVGRYMGRLVRVRPDAQLQMDIGATLAVELGRAGYHTVATQTAGVPRALLAGFEVVEDLSDVTDNFKPLRTTRLLVEAAIRELADRPAGAPFFLWLHTMDVHAPYLAGRAPGGPVERYDGQVAEVDAALESLLGWVDQAAPMTVVALTSDHGERLGEGGRFGHGGSLDEPEVRVPLALWGPGVPMGVRVPRIVELVDLSPTLIALAGLPGRPWMDGVDLLARRPRPRLERAFLEVRGAGGSFLRGVVMPAAKVVRDLRSDLLYGWVPGSAGVLVPVASPGTDPRLADARMTLLAWEEYALSGR